MQTRRLGCGNNQQVVLANTLGVIIILRDAQQARGLVLSRGSLKVRLKALLPILVAMVIQALRTTENLTRALEARGLGGSYDRTSMRDIRMRSADWTALALVGTGLGLLLIARFAWGLGSQPVGLIASL